ncbi:MAG: UDP-2,3-diacylglucosamine diphosphatase LpxI [Myxococcota bacterium]
MLGLIAGSGPLPFEVAQAARERGLRVAIAAIEHNTDPAIEREADGAFRWLNAGQLAALIAFMKESGAREVILAGAVSKAAILRDPSRLRPDARALALLGSLAARGDDAILRAVAAELESEGLCVVESTRYLGERMVKAGVLCGGPPDAATAGDLALGMRLIESLGAHDVGQACLVRQGTVLAVEALEGTDRMLRRGAEFGSGAVLVKAAKPGQDMRFDVPVIGPGTLEVAALCKLRAIGLEAGRTLVLEQARTLAQAESAGITIVGLARSEEGA